MEASREEKPSAHVTDARARAQRAKLDLQEEQRHLRSQPPSRSPRPIGKRDPQKGLARRRANATIADALEDFIADHEGCNHSPKTIQWHRNALTLLCHFVAAERTITLVAEVDAPDIRAWVADLPRTLRWLG